MSEIASAFVRIRPDFSGFKTSALSEAEKQLKGLQTSVTETEDAIKKAARENITAAVSQRESLTKLHTEYALIAKGAVKGSEVQLEANRKAAESARQLGYAYKEVGASTGLFARHAASGRSEEDKLARGALAGSGALRSMGRSLAFASGGFLAAGGFVAAIKDSISQAGDLEAQLNRTSDVFRGSAEEVKKWSQASVQAMGITQASALDAASTIGTLLQNLGKTPAAAAAMSTKFVQLAADMAAFKKVAPEVALSALEAGLMGRTRSLKQFGIVIDNSLLKAEALRLGLMKGAVSMQAVTDAQTKVNIAQANYNKALADYGPRSTQAARATVALHEAQNKLAKETSGATGTLTAQQKSLAAYNVILEQSKVQHGAFSRSQGEAAIQQQKFHAALQQLEAEIGTGILPVFTQYTTEIGNWLAKASNSKKVQDDAREAAHLLKDVITAMIAVVKQVKGAFDGLSGAVGGSKHAFELLAGVFVAWKTAELIGRIKGVATSIGLIKTQSEGAAGARGVSGLISKLGILKAIGPIAITVTVLEVWRKQIFGAGTGKDLSSPTTADTIIKAKYGGKSYEAVMGTGFGDVLAKINAGKKLSAQDISVIAAQPSAVQVGASGWGSPAAAAGGAAVKWVGATSGLKSSFMQKLAAAVQEAGGTAINVISGKRSDASHPGGPVNGGASNSNHLTGAAADGTAVIGGRQYPLGAAPINYAKWGLRAGSSFDWGGLPDNYHVDDGSNVNAGAPLPPGGGTNAGAQPPSSGTTSSGSTGGLFIGSKAPKVPSLSASSVASLKQTLATLGDKAEGIAPASLRAKVEAQIKQLTGSIHTGLGATAAAKVRADIAALRSTVTTDLRMDKGVAAVKTAVASIRATIGGLPGPLRAKLAPEMKKVQDELGKITTPAQLAKAKADYATLKKDLGGAEKEMATALRRHTAEQLAAWRKHLGDMTRVTSTQKTAWGNAFSELVSAATTVFDRGVQRHIDTMNATLQRALADLDAQMQTQTDRFDAQQKLLTPAEQALKDLQDAKAAGDRQRADADAVNAQADAKNKLAASTIAAKIAQDTYNDAAAKGPLKGETTDDTSNRLADLQQKAVDAAQAVIDATQAVNDAKTAADDAAYADKEAALQATAQQERDALDASIQRQRQAAQTERDVKAKQMQDDEQAAIQDYQDAQDIQRKALETQLANWKDHLDIRHTTIAAANSQVLDIMSSFGLDPAWFNAGNDAGNALLTGLAKAFASNASALAPYQQAVQNQAGVAKLKPTAPLTQSDKTAAILAELKKQTELQKEAAAKDAANFLQVHVVPGATTNVNQVLRDALR